MVRMGINIRQKLGVSSIYITIAVAMVISTLLAIAASSPAKATYSVETEIQSNDINLVSIPEIWLQIWNDVSSYNEDNSDRYGGSATFCDSKNMLPMQNETNDVDNSSLVFFTNLSPMYCGNSQYVWRCTISGPELSGTSANVYTTTCNTPSQEELDNGTAMTAAYYKQLQEDEGITDDDLVLDEDEDGSEDGDDDTCESNFYGFGWILCAGVNLLNDIITGFLTWIDGQLNWTFLAQNSGEIITRWQDFVNIANVLFVIAFLVMIYSMATLTGLSNYDVKKMLPRLIIVAAAVNLSFYICAALADLSNIAGSGLYNLLSGGADAIHVEINLDDALVAGVVLIVTVIAAFAFIGSGLIAIILIFACLYLRQVALIILTIVSPIALVCYLLPNTEQWTKKWFNWYTRMLLIYPMFAAVWGGSLWLANTITSTSLGSSETMPIPDFVPQMICLVIPAVSIVPLFKASGGLMGMVSNRVAGGLARTGMANRINNTTRKPVKAVGRGVGRAATNNFVTRAATGAVGSGAGHLASKMNHGIGKPFARGLYGLSNKANTHAGYVSAQAKAIDDQAMAQAKSDLSQMSQADLMTIATTGMYNNKVADEHILRAATELTQDSMDEGDVKKMLISRAALAEDLKSKGRNDEAQRLLNNAADGAKKSGHYAGTGGALDKGFRDGKWGGNAEQAYNNAVAQKYSRMSAEQIANTSSSTLEHMNEAVKGATGSDRDAAVSNIKASQQAIAQNANLQNKMSNKAMDQVNKAAKQMRTTSEHNYAIYAGVDDLVAAHNSNDPQMRVAAASKAMKLASSDDFMARINTFDRNNIEEIATQPINQYRTVIKNDFGTVTTKQAPPTQGTPPQRP